MGIFLFIMFIGALMFGVTAYEAGYHKGFTDAEDGEENGL